MTQPADPALLIEEDAIDRFTLGHADRLWSLLLRSPGLLVSGLSLLGLSTAAVLIEPRVFGWAIDQAIVTAERPLWHFVLLLAFVILIRTGASAAQAYVFEILGARIVRDLRVELFAHIQRLPISLFDRTPVGRLLTRVTSDVSAIGEMFSMGLLSIIGNVAVVLGILVALMTLSPKLGFISLSIFPFLVVLTILFSARLSRCYRIARSRLSGLNAYLAENLLGIRVLQLFNREPIHFERYRTINQSYADAQIDTVKTFALFQPMITLSTGASMALAIGFGGRAVIQGELTPGMLVAFFAYVLALFQPIREIADKWNVFLSGMASAERVFQILEGADTAQHPWYPERIARGGAARLVLKGDIRFEKVSFAYNDGEWVLQDFSLELRAGQTLGIVGHTGSGKSTLIQLLLRFYEPQRGRILIDGRDIREYDLTALRGAFGLIQQDVFVFAGSFVDNLTLFGSSALRPEDLSIATGQAHEREILERGANLSQGQKQMLAFERARLSQPSIWILDEASANLDSSSEEDLRRSLDAAAAGQTRLIVAHRLATIRDADRIIVLHKGKLVESGTHPELMRLGGLYARLERLNSDSV